jgi:cysteine synthase
MIANNITELIWNTPLLKLPLKNSNWGLLLKIEKFNPWQSMKDRMALNMVEEAEKIWLLKPGWTIIESSSWNTWIWLSIVAAQKWYNTKLL